MNKIILIVFFSLSGLLVSAQDSSPKISGSFFQVILDSGFLGILIWGMLFVCSIFTLWGIVDAFLKLRLEKICPTLLQEPLKQALEEGNVAGIIELCNENQSSFSDIIKQAFIKTEKGYSAMEETAVMSIQVAEDKIMSRLSYLNLCGVVAPMLGLLGTVTGMVDAFFTLGNTSGVEKAQMLAMAISQALYTTAAGLFISIPAIIAYNIFKNKAASIMSCIEKETGNILDDVKGRLQ